MMMIRRSPTRIELKLEDLQEFEYIQKYEKKKTLLQDAQQQQKLLRQERIGLGGAFRSVRSGTVSVPSSGAITPIALAANVSTPVANTTNNDSIIIASSSINTTTVNSIDNNSSHERIISETSSNDSTPSSVILVDNGSSARTTSISQSAPAANSSMDVETIQSPGDMSISFQ